MSSLKEELASLVRLSMIERRLERLAERRSKH
nr:hypothetical protein [Tanacetum cinerariifolium]